MHLLQYTLNLTKVFYRNACLHFIEGWRSKFRRTGNHFFVPHNCQVSGVIFARMLIRAIGDLESLWELVIQRQNNSAASNHNDRINPSLFPARYISFILLPTFVLFIQQQLTKRLSSAEFHIQNPFFGVLIAGLRSSQATKDGSAHCGFLLPFYALLFLGLPFYTSWSYRYLCPYALY